MNTLHIPISLSIISDFKDKAKEIIWNPWFTVVCFFAVMIPYAILMNSL